MSVISSEFKDKFIKSKQLYESSATALKLAKKGQMGANLIKELTIHKQNAKADYTALGDELLTKMGLKSNVIHIRNAWHAIRYVDNEGNTKWSIEPLTLGGVSKIKRDSRHEAEITEDELSKIVHSVIDQEFLENYKIKLAEQANDLIAEPDEEEEEEQCEELEADNELVVKHHACRRWAERLLGIPEHKSTAYVSKHWEEVKGAVLSSYEKAELFWDESPEVDFYYNADDNVMFVSTGLAIITLYEEDFGFTKDINVMITFKQRDVLAEAHSTFRQLEKESKQAMTETKQAQSVIDDQVEVLQAQIALLLSEKESLEAKEVTIVNSIQVARAKFKSEHNKLFKKWESEASQ